MTGKHSGKKDKKRAAAAAASTAANMSQDPENGSISDSDSDDTAAMANSLDNLLDPAAETVMDHSASNKRRRSGSDGTPTSGAAHSRKLSKGDLAASTTDAKAAAEQQLQQQQPMETAKTTADILTRHDDRIIPLIFSDLRDNLSLIQFGIDLTAVSGRLELNSDPMQKMQRGSIIVFPANVETFNKLVKYIDNPTPLKRNLGPDVRVHFPQSEIEKTKKRSKPATDDNNKLPKPHYVMVRSVPADLGPDCDILKAILLEEKYKDEENGNVVVAVKRIHNKAGNPLPLVKLQVRSAQDINNLVKDGLLIMYHHFQCEPCHELPVPHQCDKCLVWGGHPTNKCKSAKLCIRCGSHEHPSRECPIDKENRKCSNCGGNHIALYKGCKAYKDAQNRLIEQQKEKKKNQNAALTTTTGSATANQRSINRDRSTNRGSYSQAAHSAVSTAAHVSAIPVAVSTPPMKADQAVELLSTLISSLLHILQPSLQINPTLVQTVLLAVTPLLGELPADNVLARINAAQSSYSQ